MKIYCDMDGVLVNQTGRDRFDVMPWMPDGKALWAFLGPLKPTILSMLRPDIYERCKPQKQAWCERELGKDVEVIVTPYAVGKGPYASFGALLIDDDYAMHAPPWVRNCGTFIHHRNAAESIRQLKALLG